MLKVIMSGFCGSLLRNNFIKGYMAGLASHKAYDHVQETLSTQKDNKDNKDNKDSMVTSILNTKIKSYDTNNDGKITLGELLDGAVKDFKNYDSKSKDSEPTVLFVIKNKDTTNDTTNDNTKNSQ